MSFVVHSYTPGVSADVTIDGIRMTVPEAPGNRHWEMLMDWLADGNSWPATPSPSLSDLKKDRLAELAAKRWACEIGGITLSGMSIKTDVESAAKLTAARVTADANPAYVIENWKVAPGVFVSLDAATIVMISDAVRDHVQSCFDREAAISEEIMAAGSEAELAAIDINAGWAQEE